MRDALDALGLGADNVQVQFHSYRLKMLNGEAHVLYRLRQAARPERLE